MNAEQAKKLRAPFPPEATTKAGLPRQRLRNAPVFDRLMFRTVKDPPGCWYWLGATNTKGYGNIRGDKNATVISVHRVSYEHHYGPIPDGLEIDHLCSVRACVNPEHLEAVDHRTNVLRGRHNQNHGKTHCIHGHEFSQENTSFDVRGRRSCRTCNRERMREYRAARAA